MADYNENYIPELPSIGESYDTNTSVVGQEDAELTVDLPDISDSYSTEPMVTGQEDADYDLDLPDIGESFTTDPACITCDFEADETIVAVDQDINFTDLSSGIPDTWLWDFGDGETSTDQNPTHAYAISGVYEVTLQATRTDLLSSTTATETKTGYIEVVVQADFSATPVDGDPPLTVQFTDLSESTPDTWYWEFGDGGTSTDQNPEHEYTTGGYYSVRLTVTKSGATDVERKINYISITGKTAKAMAHELALRLEDPNEQRFTPGGKFIMLNKAQIETMNRLHEMYLTEIERIESDLDLTDRSYDLSSLNSGNGVYKGAEGIKRIQVDVAGAGTLIDVIPLEFDEIKETENPYMAGSDSLPMYYIDHNKIIILVDTYTNTTITVSYLAIPADMSSESDPTINDVFQNIIITLAESYGWQVEGKLDRKQGALTRANIEIDYYNNLVPLFYIPGRGERAMKDRIPTIPRWAKRQYKQRF